MEMNHPKSLTTPRRYPTGAVTKLDVLAKAAQKTPGEYFDELMDREFTKAEPFIIQSQKLAREMMEVERRLA